jgi:hypothetical protein
VVTCECRRTLLDRYVHRRKAALKRIYGRRWAEVYNLQTMLKDDDYGDSE